MAESDIGRGTDVRARLRDLRVASGGAVAILLASAALAPAAIYKEDTLRHAVSDEPTTPEGCAKAVSQGTAARVLLGVTNSKNGGRRVWLNAITTLDRSPDRRIMLHTYTSKQGTNKTEELSGGTKGATESNAPGVTDAPCNMSTELDYFVGKNVVGGIAPGNAVKVGRALHFGVTGTAGETTFVTHGSVSVGQLCGTTTGNMEVGVFTVARARLDGQDQGYTASQEDSAPPLSIAC